MLPKSYHLSTMRFIKKSFIKTLLRQSVMNVNSKISICNNIEIELRPKIKCKLLRVGLIKMSWGLWDLSRE